MRKKDTENSILAREKKDNDRENGRRDSAEKKGDRKDKHKKDCLASWQDGTSPVPDTASGEQDEEEPLPYGAISDLQKVQDSLNRSSDDGKPPAGSTYQAEKVLGSGSFGVVYLALVLATGDRVAIKKVLQDKRYKNRELQIMQELKHPNIVEFFHAFHTAGDKKTENYLNVVMEYCSETVHQVMKHYLKMKQQVPQIIVQLYTYQVLHGCTHMHAMSVCHRDIKPQNLLVDGHTHAVKICDFGSAKRLSKGEPNVAYICSRFYRAPELIFGSTDYSPLIDLWSVACVTGEMILGQVLFAGDTGVDQLMEMIKVLGTPTKDDLTSMNPKFLEFKFPQIKSRPWVKIFRKRTSDEAVDWISRLLQYNPTARPSGLESCGHTFFDDLRIQDTKICGDKPLPEYLFWFSKEETALMDDEMKKKLIPEYVTLEQGGAWSNKKPPGRLRQQRSDGADPPASASPKQAAQGTPE